MEIKFQSSVFRFAREEFDLRKYHHNIVELGVDCEVVSAEDGGDSSNGTIECDRYISRWKK
jgi:hypothetical protein